MNNIKVTFDRYRRMNYHPDIHTKHKQPWTTTDQKYLIENYEKLGPEQISFELERTMHTIMRRVCDLRKTGLMEPAKPVGQRKSHKHLHRANS